jgi:hypothetical protein
LTEPLSFPKPLVSEQQRRLKNGVASPRLPQRITFTVTMVRTQSPVLIWIKVQRSDRYGVNGKVFTMLQAVRWFVSLLTIMTKNVR